MRYDAVLLDADGTLFDFEAAERSALSSVLVRLHLTDPSAPETYSRINAACWADYEQGRITQPELRIRRFRELIEAYGLQADATDAAEAFVDQLSRQAPLLPDAERVVREISARLPIALVTNGISEVQHGRFARSAIRFFVRELVVSGDVGVAKPDPRLIWEALRRLGVAPERAILVGDSLTSDIAGAQNAGVAACWYNPKGVKCTLAKPPEYEIRALDELTQLLFDGEE